MGVGGGDAEEDGGYKEGKNPTQLGRSCTAALEKATPAPTQGPAPLGHCLPR